jgi:hypothetical protein
MASKTSKAQQPATGQGLFNEPGLLAGLIDHERNGPRPPRGRRSPHRRLAGPNHPRVG